MGWSRIKRMRSLLVVFMLVVILVTIGSLALHSLAVRVSLLSGEPQQVINRASRVARNASLSAADKQQSGRHLLATRNLHTSLTKASQRELTSYIKLEGVDSIGHDMFVVYGASVDQLKSICSSLSDCEGFNSEGWVKSKIKGKKRAVINLYVKQTAPKFKGETVLNDSDAGIFSQRLDEYSEMEQNLKIYIYETNIGSDMPSYKDYKYGVEYMFISLLAKSKFRTKDPKQATFFFLPARCTAYRKTVSSLTDGIDKAADVMRLMVEQVKVQFPFWNASLGTDHFYICAHDMGTELVKTSDTDLWKNSIGLVNTADYSEPLFVPHKDISLPPHPGRGVVNWSMVGQGGATFDPLLRTQLAFMAGHPGRGPVRPKIYEMYGSDPEFRLVKGYITDEEYLKALKTTRFCLCPRGNKAWSPRIMDALWFGCIPVLISDYYVPPLLGLVEWDSVTITVPESQVKDLKKILISVSNEQIREMQINIQRVYKHLTWNDPVQPYDAFHSILFQLWQKRHIRRTLSSSSLIGKL